MIGLTQQEVEAIRGIQKYQNLIFDFLYDQFCDELPYGPVDNFTHRTCIDNFVEQESMERKRHRLWNQQLSFGFKVEDEAYIVRNFISDIIRSQDNIDAFLEYLRTEYPKYSHLLENPSIVNLILPGEPVVEEDEDAFYVKLVHPNTELLETVKEIIKE